MGWLLKSILGAWMTQAAARYWLTYIFCDMIEDEKLAEAFYDLGYRIATRKAQDVTIPKSLSGDPRWRYCLEAYERGLKDGQDGLSNQTKSLQRVKRRLAEWRDKLKSLLKLYKRYQRYKRYKKLRKPLQKVLALFN